MILYNIVEYIITSYNILYYTTLCYVVCLLPQRLTAAPLPNLVYPVPQDMVVLLTQRLATAPPLPLPNLVYPVPPPRPVPRPLASGTLPRGPEAPP